MNCLCCRMRFFRKETYLVSRPTELPGPAPIIRISTQMQEEQKVQSDNEPKMERRPGVPAQPIRAEDDAEDTELPKYDKDSGAEKLIRSALMANEFLRNLLDDERLMKVVDAMYLRRFQADEFVITEGEQGAHLYVSEQGTFEVTKGKMFVKKFKGGEAFGELAILYDTRRYASVQALTAARVWTLDRRVYQRVMVRTAMDEQRSYVEFLKSVPQLSRVHESLLARVSNLFKKEFFATGTTIVHQGDRGDKFYFIKAGSVLVTKLPAGSAAVEENVGTLHKGQYFGELALLQEDRRQASCIAQAPGVECLTLDRKNFIENFGDLDTLMKDYSAADQQHQQHQQHLQQQQQQQQQLVQRQAEYGHIGLDDLDHVKTLGVGGFGRVELVQYRHDKSITFALKYLKKFDVVQMQQQEHVFNEKCVMMSCDSPFIVKLHKTFRDERCLYFLMEPCLGGDVWNMLQKARGGCFEDKTARFMTACVVEALAYLHGRQLVYRDLKPENILVDRDGYLKLADFGFAKFLGSRAKTYTFAGTPEYIAPEIILNRGHGKAVDYWALGIFIHELVTGRPPFRAADQMKTYNLILRGIDHVDFSTRVPKQVAFLVRRLCQAVPADRLGCQRNGAQDIRDARWFLGLDWELLRRRAMPAPYHVHVRHHLDTSNFDSYPRDSELPPAVTTGWDDDF